MFAKTHKDQRLKDCAAIKATIRLTRPLRLQLIHTIKGSQGRGALIPSQVLKENKFFHIFLITYIRYIYIDELGIFRNKQHLF